MKIHSIILVLLFTFGIFAHGSLDNFKDVVIEKADRTVNAQSQLLKVETRLTFKNERDTLLREVYLALPTSLKPFLKVFSITEDGSEQSYTVVDDLQIQKEYHATLYRIALATPLKSQQSITFTVNEIYWGRMEALPKKIGLTDDQKMVLVDNVYLFSPYVVLSQSTLYKLAGPIISHTDLDGKIKGAQLEYRFSTAVNGFNVRDNRIHFENNTPFVVFKKVQKTIEVSHWGNIYIEESYQLKNEGAEFKGEYSRIDFNQYTATGKSALKGLTARYPVHSWGMHYRDEVGNVSTSRAVRNNDHVFLQITPRYSIFGGWAANWAISYNLPTRNYLSQEDKDDTSFVLKQKFGFPFENILAEEYELRVIFPEGAHDIKVNLPFSVDESFEDKTFSYLDRQGRPTKVFRKKNVLEQNNVDFQTHYKFEQSNLFIKPILLFVLFLGFFGLLIFLGRVNIFASNKAKNE